MDYKISLTLYFTFIVVTAVEMLEAASMGMKNQAKHAGCD